MSVPDNEKHETQNICNIFIIILWVQDLNTNFMGHANEYS